MESIKIEIAGDVFSFNSDDKDLVLRSADILNENIEKLYEFYGKNTDYKRMLVLAALNTISEIYEEIEGKDARIEMLENELGEVNELLTGVIESVKVLEN